MSGDDYKPVSENLMFNSSQTYRLVNIIAKVDTEVEGEECFSLNLSSSDNVELNSAIVNIIDLTSKLHFHTYNRVLPMLNSSVY